MSPPHHASQDVSAIVYRLPPCPDPRYLNATHLHICCFDSSQGHDEVLQLDRLFALLRVVHSVKSLTLTLHKGVDLGSLALSEHLRLDDLEHLILNLYDDNRVITPVLRRLPLSNPALRIEINMKMHEGYVPQMKNLGLLDLCPSYTDPDRSAIWCNISESASLSVVELGVYRLEKDTELCHVPTMRISMEDPHGEFFARTFHRGHLPAFLRSRHAIESLTVDFTRMLSLDDLLCALNATLALEFFSLRFSGSGASFSVSSSMDQIAKPNLKHLKNISINCDHLHHYAFAHEVISRIKVRDTNQCDIHIVASRRVANDLRANGGYGNRGVLGVAPLDLDPNRCITWCHLRISSASCSLRGATPYRKHSICGPSFDFEQDDPSNFSALDMLRDLPSFLETRPTITKLWITAEPAVQSKMLSQWSDIWARYLASVPNLEELVLGLNIFASPGAPRSPIGDVRGLGFSLSQSSPILCPKLKRLLLTFTNSQSNTQLEDVLSAILQMVKDRWNLGAPLGAVVLVMNKVSYLNVRETVIVKELESYDIDLEFQEADPRGLVDLDCPRRV